MEDREMKEIYRNDGMILKINESGRYIVTCSESDTIYISGTKEDVLRFLKKQIEIYSNLWSDVSKFICRTSKEMLDFITA